MLFFVLFLFDFCRELANEIFVGLAQYFRSLCEPECLTLHMSLAGQGRGNI